MLHLEEFHLQIFFHLDVVHAVSERFAVAKQPKVTLMFGNT